MVGGMGVCGKVQLLSTLLFLEVNMSCFEIHMYRCTLVCTCILVHV